MKKDVRQIRKNIAKRKKEHPLSHSVPDKQVVAPFPQEEEKHGYLPFIPSQGQGTSPSSRRESFAVTLILKGILAGVLFFGVSMIHQLDADWVERPKQWTTQAFSEEFPFASVNAWYQNKFGSPLAMVPNQEETEELPAVLPVNGTVSQSFQSNGEAIRIAANEKSEVVAVEDGTVIFAGKKSDTGKTVIVQHADRSKSIYGYLTDIDVYQYQFIGDNHVIGQFDPVEGEKQDIYFAIQKNNQYLDPVQVMQVDEQP
ncbi:peptidoglycan DD-metalloendopeptidase family protein [Sediminibacillus dalangtanensis]|uniref:Peptidoglycan DD-metalloendopeptidase family protein n=1 Tax=Sediminibacillus dalangtanensis TaxID=2729421 RepID=A0ABX7VTV3_9BACI|nr:M23 family metallopeptidase [Sediminibacillus dalangtanensis]QTM99953.1 peptidoglycan DD-metalloendopeptidase family protein [Sediminibacillus dalangtanensis]